MGKAFRLDIKGLDKVKALVEDAIEQMPEDVNAFLETKADKIVDKAVGKLREIGDTGFLSNSVKVLPQQKDLEWVVQVGAFYGPYVEFGTGGLVDIPSNPEGVTEVAAQFKGQGIKKVNLPARPFLFPAYREATQDIIKELKEFLTK